ncbi:hypothetical protein AA101099_1788 [Neoasaia chiangmaiensis NBRC 101099]|uniref:Abi-alpha family protein n=1 Tax=Neoasaia chiangmaiensis TaxID=320497 RepID=UPI0011BEFC3E|nr:hypothetical protein [Neoasaia chiangmaiensis]GBR39718.1 hypothetical protein AA101099_1788 [Neoasaia chiangmaiensis NBRC 101099]
MAADLILQMFNDMRQAQLALPGVTDASKELVNYLISDPLRRARQRRETNSEAVMALARAKIGDQPTIPSDEISETNTRPILEATMDDDRKEFQEIWACLLAKTATGHLRGFRREFIKTLRSFEPIDLLVFRYLYGVTSPVGPNKYCNIDGIIKFVESASHESGANIYRNEIEISLSHLTSLNIFTKPSNSIGIERLASTAYGAQLYTTAHSN